MASIVVTIEDIFDELLVENNRLMNELLFANKLKKFLIKLIEKYESVIDCEDKQQFNDLIQNMVINGKKSVDNNSHTITDQSDVMYDNSNNSCVSLNLQTIATNDEDNQWLPEDTETQNIKQTKSEPIYQLNSSEVMGPKTRKYEMCYDSATNLYVCRNPKCNGKSFEKYDQLYQHMRNHSDKRFKCHVCDKGFIKPSDVRVHLLVHSDTKPFKCPHDDCTYETKYKSAVAKHIKVSHRNERPFSCPIPECGLKFAAKQNLLIHIQRHSNEYPFWCTFDGCDKRFKIEKSLKEHSLIHSSAKTLKCYYIGCNEMFRTIYNRKKHIHIVHKKTNLQTMKSFDDNNHLLLHTHRHSDEYRFRCTFSGCDKQFKIEEYLKTHSLIHMNVNKDDIINSLEPTHVNSEDNINNTTTGQSDDMYDNSNNRCDPLTLQSIATDDKDDECLSEDSETKNVKQTKRERKKSLKDNSSEEKKQRNAINEDINCLETTDNINKSTIGQSDDLYDNNSCDSLTLQSIAIDNVDDEWLPEESEKQNFKQTKSEPKNSNNIKLVEVMGPKTRRYEMCYDSATNLYVCRNPKCNGKSFEKYDQLYQHMRNHSDKRFKCHVCDKGFIKSSDVRVHLLVHSDTKPFKCPHDDCTYETKYKSAVAQHIKVSHRNERPFSCPIADCGLTFAAKQQLLKHTQLHSNEYPFRCTFDGCDKRFKVEGYLKVHSLIHSSAKTLKCYYIGCNEMFRTISNRKKHIHMVHKKPNLPKFISCDWPGCEYKTRAHSSMKPHKQMHTNDRPFQCDWPDCNKRFRRLQLLNEHKHIHTNDKPHACHWPGCHYRCNDTANLRKHLRTTHNIFDELSIENNRLINELLFANKLKKFLMKLIEKYESVIDCEDKQQFDDLTQEMTINGNLSVRYHSPVQSVTKQYKCRQNDCTFQTNSKPYYNKHLSVNHREDREESLFCCQIPDCGFTCADKHTLHQHIQLLHSKEENVNNSDNIDQSLNLKDKKSKRKVLKTYSVKRKHESMDAITGNEDINCLVSIEVKCEDNTTDTITGQSIASDNVDNEWLPKESETQNVKQIKKIKPKKTLTDEDNSCSVKVQNIKKYDYCYDSVTNLYVCPHDSKSFEKYDRLYEHFMRIHVDRRFKCQVCDKSFKSGKAVRNHSVIHSVTKQYKCPHDDCNFEANYKNYIEKHIRIIHRKERQFLCPIPDCGLTFAEKQNLLIHIQRHSNEYPFWCTFDGCDKRFKIEKSLKEHSLIHSSAKTLKCYYIGCNEMFRTISNRKKHIHIVHKKTNLQTIKSCDWPGCEYKTKHPSAMVEHKRYHEDDRPFQCDWPDCNKRFRRLQLLNEHKHIHTNDKPHACHWPGCHYRCNDKANLRKHLRTIHHLLVMASIVVTIEDIFDELSIENNRLMNELLFANKLKTFLMKLIEKYESVIDCEDKQHFNDLTQEMTINGKKSQSLDCRNNSDKGLDQLDKYVDRKDIVRFANQILSTKVKKSKTLTKIKKMKNKNVIVFTGDSNSLRQTLVDNKDIVNDTITDQSVDKCRQMVCTDGTTNWDQNDVQSIGCNDDFDCMSFGSDIIQNKERLDSSDRQQKLFEDKINFSKKSSRFRKSDLYYESVTNSYVCPHPECNKSFAEYRLLHKHIKYVHSQTIINCNVCDKSFKNPKCLSVHLLLHSDVKPHKCPHDDCPYASRNKQLLKLHIKQNHSDERPFVCPIADCGDKFLTKNNLKGHMLTHSDERPFRCEFVGCGKTFKTNYSLKGHLLRHTTEPTLKCHYDGCNEMFLNFDRRQRHVSTVHKKKPKKTNPSFRCDWPGCEFRAFKPYTVKEHKRVHTDERPFVCDWPDCGKRFRWLHVLAEHKHIHINDKPHACHWPGCHYRCNDKSNLRKHLRTTHK
ncbi:zinc finger protein 91-like [Oppia nitens]|uniref:zinc finger protein 91-like n=1 Tax=Oppia nitens TaxID=1686743 RepID=UPI0023DAAC55|nr:zinc finger protein 91-like [Oppia nitens]